MPPRHLRLVLWLNTGFYDKGVLIMNRKEIAVNYLSQSFRVDLFSNIPFQMLMFLASNDTLHMNYELLNMLRTLKLSRFHKLS